MSSKSLGRKLKGIKNGIGSILSKHMLCRSNSHVALDVTPIEPIQQGQWASLPPELLLDIIRRVEKSETSWPARAVVIFCASVCKSWRSATLEIVKTPQQCGRITFPISVKQVINYFTHFLV
jgi:tubby and related proteins